MQPFLFILNLKMRISLRLWSYCFQKKLTKLSLNKKKIALFPELNEKLFHASYKVSLKTAKTDKPCTFGESLFLPVTGYKDNAILEEK